MGQGRLTISPLHEHSLRAHTWQLPARLPGRPDWPSCASMRRTTPTATGTAARTRPPARARGGRSGRRAQCNGQAAGAPTPSTVSRGSSMPHGSDTCGRLAFLIVGGSEYSSISQLASCGAVSTMLARSASCAFWSSETSL
eukprot:3115080-Prymnesium_polylepis.2